ncbi:hypothetical protein [Flavobacterium sp. PL12]|uniref:sacsin N-terminal ATP-binding-like domain-containing protein n=1 Tax=Flavobacterium sp. PL12 TaxID=3071718 RepID=UPI00319EA24E
MSQLTTKGIVKLIDIYTKTYTDNPSIMLSGYGQENQTVADYNGRQILELMQNADDAQSDCIYIELDTTNKVLSIANNGTAFSLEGIESLMYTGLSSKNKVEFIGNKGLGFRSILNWVHQVSILTKEVSFRFSKNYSEQYYDKFIAVKDVVKERIEKEIEAKKLAVGEKPVAALAFPEIIPEQLGDFVTKVVLDCKEEMATIDEQIATIKEETLLFLPHIKKIIVVKDGINTVDLNKTLDIAHEININETNWNCYRSTEQHYDEKVKFKYAIAWKDNWEVEGFFFNYFPTDVTTALPCIIHATFDLTNNRKEINNNAQNTFILNEIVTALGEIAEKHLKTSPTNWRAYQFLTPKLPTGRKVLKTFYENVIAKRESNGCYPTLDGKYVTKEEVVYHGEAFSRWVEENDLGDYFPNLLKKSFEKMNNAKRYSAEAFSELVQELNPSLNLEQRIELIGILAINEEGCFNGLHSNALQLPLLLNTKGTIVSSNIRVFTKDTDDSDLEFPDYIKDHVQFISIELYNKIRQTFSKEIAGLKFENESGDARAVKRFLDPIINIGLDDIIGVILQIVSETNKTLKTATNQQDIIQQMVLSLFSIFKDNPNRRGNLSSIEKIPLLSRSHAVKYADELYFGKEYTAGIATEKIFEGIKDNNDYLASNEFFKINGEEEVIINFFKWLNVNQYTRFEIIQKSLGRHDHDEYSNFILKLHKGQSTNVHKNYAVKSIKSFDAILKNKAFSIEKLIAWIAKDEQFLEQLRWTSTDQFYTTYNTVRTDIQHKPSYLLSQIVTSGITRNVVASMPIAGISTFKSINTTDTFFTDLKIKEYIIEEIIDLLHIKNSFNDLDPEQIYQVLQNDQSQFEGNSQSFYKLLYDYFRANEQTKLESYQPDFTNIEYYCRKGGVGKEYSLIPASNVYYSDNKLLPQKILDNYWFINLPKRTGENRIAKFFGVNLIKDIVADIEFNVGKDHEVTNELNDYINRLKPYWLSYRLEALNKDAKTDTARNLKELKIKVVKEATYTLSDGQVHNFDTFDFIPKDNLVVIKYSENCTLDGLKSISLFCDLIAEIVCVVFKVADLKNTYRRIFKDGVKETFHILQSDEKEYLLEEAKKLLGISEEELSFWKKVFPGKVADGDNELYFINSITTNLGVPLPNFYKNIDFSNLGTEIGVKFLKWLSINVTLKLEDVIKLKTLENWHKQQFNNYIKDYSNHFEQLLWIKCAASTDRNEKELFFTNLIHFDNESNSIYAHFANQNTVILEPKYNDLVIKWTEDKFQINLQFVIEKEVDVSIKYKTTLKAYSYGESIEDMEKIIKHDNPKLYGLMYFEGFENEVKLECDKQTRAKTAEYGDPDENNDHEDTALIIVESALSNGTFPSSNGLRSGYKGGSYNSKGVRNKAASGKKQEDKVKNSLLKQGFLVNHVSNKTDARHYDLEYKKEGDTEWRFLEVKKDSGGYFFLSKAEKETAISKMNVEKYDLAIVGDNTIHIIKSPFNFNDESFENNSNFHAEPTEYKINFKIEDHKN